MRLYEDNEEAKGLAGKSFAPLNAKHIDVPSVVSAQSSDQGIFLSMVYPGKDAHHADDRLNELTEITALCTQFD